MPMKLDPDKKQVLQNALPAIVAFKTAFRRDISAAFLAELLAAYELDLTLADSSTAHGADAFDSLGRRNQIKQRDPHTLNVDVNNFDLDYLILVNLDSNYHLHGMWQLTTEEVQHLVKHRPDYRKYQITQSRLKAHAKRIR